MFRLLELPSALPVIFGGLKLSVILAVVGAVVGEFVGADVGLGFLINLARGVLDTPLMFVAIFALIIIAQFLYLTVSLDRALQPAVATVTNVLRSDHQDASPQEAGHLYVATSIQWLVSIDRVASCWRSPLASLCAGPDSIVNAVTGSSYR